MRFLSRLIPEDITSTRFILVLINEKISEIEIGDLKMKLKEAIEIKKKLT